LNERHKIKHHVLELGDKSEVENLMW
jgi:hypothetical protein